jgi:hypothetical protein
MRLVAPISPPGENRCGRTCDGAGDCGSLALVVVDGALAGANDIVSAGASVLDAISGGGMRFAMSRVDAVTSDNGFVCLASL